MGDIYYVDAADWLRDEAGLVVVEVEGWTTRARSSGGFASPPLGIQWHHTASSSTPEGDTNWQYHNSDDAPIGNMTIMRDGAVWIGAAGAANTAGKGGPVTLSRGVVPVDQGNSTTWAFEVANNGVGEAWPVVQIDAYFAASNCLNAHFGNLPSDVYTHAIGSGNGWTDRKIDPATAAAVQGPWQPRSVSSSGTWSLDDIRAECQRRANRPPPEEDDVTDEDVERIAQRAAELVWDTLTKDITTGENQTFENLVRYTRADVNKIYNRLCNALLAVDDGIWSGNANLADVCFLIGFILAVLSTIAAYTEKLAVSAGVFLSGAVAAAVLGWLVL